ncbi:MAG: dienelactone hydrolase family protein [Aquabacterium sp.]
MNRLLGGLVVRFWVAAMLALATATLARAQVPAAPAAPTVPDRLAADLREEIHRVNVKVRDLYGREEVAAIAVTVFRPPGEGPFPAVLLSHGRAAGEARAQPVRQRFEQVARFLVAKGLAVFVPTRLGYGATFGAFDPEESGACGAKRYEPMASAAADQLQAVMAHAATLPYVDPARWVAMGQSVGGMATLALAARRPAGLLAAINVAGGAGGDPKGRPSDPCSPQQLEALWRQQAGSSGGLPTLWIYWTHDLYWGGEHPRRWAQAWRAGGGQVTLHHLQPWAGEPADGHLGLGRDMDRWAILVEDFLQPLGLRASGLPSRPPASGHARIDEIDRLPFTAGPAVALYRAFLASRAPRAFAVGPDGATGWAAGDWAIGRALGNCQWRRGQPCRLYAVDDDVVWTP